MKILFVGGGTLGSVSPLLAIAQDLLKQKGGHELEFWITKSGPEKAVIESLNIKYKFLVCGKWRRYWSWKNFLAPLQTLIGFMQASQALREWRPDLIFTAGSFVAVPVALAARVKGIPIIAHQQDVQVGLANKIIMMLAKVVTCVFFHHRGRLPKRTIITGNPVREEFLALPSAQTLIANKQKLGLTELLPVVVIFGGSSGASALNKLIVEALPKLKDFCQVVHVTGTGKELLIGQHPNYLYLPFVTEAQRMVELLSVADVVISRSGMGTLSELSALGKAAVLIPIPQTHQEFNALEMSKQGGVVMIDQTKISSDNLVEVVGELLADTAKLNTLQERIKIALPTISGGEYFNKVQEALHR